VPPVDQETSGHGARGGDNRGDRTVRPQARAEQQAARRRPDRAADHGPPADCVTAQVRRPFLVLLGERPLAPRPL
jgi:hypothetical protein